MSSRDASEGAGDRAPVSGIALLTLLALLFLGMVVLGIATGDVPIDNKALAFAPVFYSLTVMGGLVAYFFGFIVLGQSSAAGAIPHGGGSVQRL